ncbi:hypothetical protein HDU85_000237 [Gaertneriomyces sp. JEL0708]|nr:hypothetical protein HDU85_000237 [Gaertneriomyces sp. JEL0708]
MKFLLLALLASTVAALPVEITADQDAIATLERRANIPNIPSASSARTMLSDLRIRKSDADGYSRDKFPHWIAVQGACNVRETVLQRDGTNVKVGSNCAPTAGTWLSPYDGKTWKDAKDIQIDHVIPLSNAWRSGANTWSQEQRRAFANDLTNPQLVAVTGTENNSKSDQSPDEWMPTLSSFHCTYARMWVKVKSVYKLSVTAAEKSKLTSVLKSC